MELVPISRQIGVVSEVWEVAREKGPLPSQYREMPFLLFRNLFRPEEVAELLAPFRGSDHREAEVVGGGVQRHHRRTTLHQPTPPLRELFHRRIGEVVPEIERFFQIRLLGGTDLQLLEYPPGGFYTCHGDNCRILVRDRRVVGFEPVRPERKITTLLFLNREFTGGELEFCFLKWIEGAPPPPPFVGAPSSPPPEQEPLNYPGQPVVIEPEPGLLLVFPSGGLFAHRVYPVLNGHRFAIVKWWFGQ